MKKTEIESIVQARLADAEVLLKAAQFDGSVYLCGYAVELSLKARVCQTLGWDEYPTTHKYQTFKTHDLEILLHLTGLKNKIHTELMPNWSTIIKWKPEIRYKPIGSVSKTDAEQMLKSAKEVIKKL